MPPRSRSVVPELPAASQRSPAAVLGPKAERTRALILSTARRLFLERGFGGTSIPDLAAEAGISRSSFWTYFSSKLDLLRALGAEVEDEGFGLAAEFERLGASASLDDVADWVRSYLAFLDKHGAFLYAAFQAAYEDPETRAWTLSVELKGAAQLGRGVRRLRGDKRMSRDRATAEGLAILSVLERFWYHWRVAGAPFSEDTAVDTLASLIWSRAAG